MAKNVITICFFFTLMDVGNYHAIYLIIILMLNLRGVSLAQSPKETRRLKGILWQRLFKIWITG